MVTSCTDRNHQYYDEIKNFGSKNIVKFFTEKPSRMKNVSLGEALDFISFGGMNYVVYDFNTNGMIGFIQKWMQNQNGKFLWNREKAPLPKLPLINYDSCPRDKSHKTTILDISGKLRCTECINKEKLREGFIHKYSHKDNHSNLIKKFLSDNEPSEPVEIEAEDGTLIDMSWELEEYERTKFKYENAETFEWKDICYAIIKEPKNIHFPLETVLDRINCSYKFYKAKNYVITPFSGFTLADFVNGWFNQKGEKILCRQKGDEDSYQMFEDFVPISSDD